MKLAASTSTGELGSHRNEVSSGKLGCAPRPALLSLSRAERSDLERLAQHHPTGLARRAQLILARTDGYTLKTIGRRFGVHPDTVRRWLVRYGSRGLAGLRHGNLGKSRNLVFDTPIREEIRRRANTDPTVLGEPFSSWSLIKLRDHLMRREVVHTISHESLRQILRTDPPQRYWRMPRGG